MQKGESGEGGELSWDELEAQIRKEERHPFPEGANELTQFEEQQRRLLTVVDTRAD